LGLELARQSEVLGLRDARLEEDGIDQRNRDEQRVLASADEVAGFHFGGADQAVERRGNARVTEIDVRLVERRLGSRDLSGRGVLHRDRVVELALAYSLLFDERFESRDV